MLLALEILFWTSFVCLLHTYFLYPLTTLLRARKKQDNALIYSREDLPELAVIMAVHNEEKIIEEKIKSFLDSDYPSSKINFYIGSDASDDQTDKLIEPYAQNDSRIHFKRFEKRVGKIEIINRLAQDCSQEILLFTDAGAIFAPDAISRLVRHFKNPEIGIAGGRLINTNKQKKEVARQEHLFMESEWKLKRAESRLGGIMIGAYGAFFAVRRKAFAPVPPKFISDDFFITLNALQKGFQAVGISDARAFENISGKWNKEIKRKRRIAAGNFQNLAYFRSIFVSKNQKLAYAFFSHKVLRWLGPFFLILIFATQWGLWEYREIYTISLIISHITIIISLIDYLLTLQKIELSRLHFITHFYTANLALLAGFADYLKGIQTNIWEPTQREKK